MNHAPHPPVVPHVPNANADRAREEIARLKEKAEAQEVAGRHKNSGQKDHKGAR